MAPDHPHTAVAVVICDAIRRRRLLAFHYEDGLRLVQPAVLGPHRTTRKLSLLAYQVGGVSRSQRPAGWRLYTVAKVRDPEVREESFVGPPPGYRPDDELSPVICRL